MFDIDIKESAYKHGYTYDDIVNCYRFPIAIRIIGFDSSKYLYVGFDLKGNPMEILVNHNDVSVIFHAMKLRKAFESLIKGKAR